MAVTTTTEDNTLYPTMIKVNQATELLNTLRIKLMQELGWTRVGTIVYQHDIAISVRTDVLSHELHDSQIQSQKPHCPKRYFNDIFTNLLRRKICFWHRHFRVCDPFWLSVMQQDHCILCLICLSASSHISYLLGPFNRLVRQCRSCTLSWDRYEAHGMWW